MATNLTFRGMLLAAAAVGASAVPALAQDQVPATTGGQLEEVVVTATRRAEELSKVPQSISAFTAERMDQLDVKSFADIVRYTPGVQYNSGNNQISIRGVSSSAGAATTGVYIDDTPIQMRRLGFGTVHSLPGVFDLERVEVLRGPQGTLFGAGSEGGTVRYITPQPSLTDYSVYGKAEISQTQDGGPSYEGGLAVGGPIVQDKLGFRVSGWLRRDGGWIDHVDYMTGQNLGQNSNYTDTYQVHAALTWEPAPGLQITPAVFVQNRIPNNDSEYWVGISNPGNGVYKTATPERLSNKDFFVLPSLRIDYNLGSVEFISNTSLFYRNDKVNGYSGSLYNLSYFQSVEQYGQDPNYDTCTGGLCLANPQPLLLANTINLPAWGTYTSGFGYYKSVNTDTNDQTNVTQEARLQSSDPNARLSWVLGVFYSSNRQVSIEEINDPQLPALTQYLWGEDMITAWTENLLPNGDDYINNIVGHSRQTAVFGNATFSVTDQLKVQAGLRVAKTHFDFVNWSDGPQNFGLLTGNHGSDDETPVTPMGGLTYQINPDDMVYATVAKGYRIGGANPPFPAAACQPDLIKRGISSIPSSYKSDTVLSYEVGSKDRFFDRRLELSGSVFYLNWDNIQQSSYLPSCGFQYTANLGTAESKGFDLEGTWLPTDSLVFDFALGYTDASYSKTIRTGTSSNSPELANKGDKIPGSPWTFSLGAQYNTMLGDRDAYLRVDYEYQAPEAARVAGRDPATVSYDPTSVADPQTNLVSVRGGVTLNAVKLAIFVDNLFNSHPVLGLGHQDQDTLLYEATTLRPRTFGLTATYRY